MHNFCPQVLCRYFFLESEISITTLSCFLRTVNREALDIRQVIDGCFHELIVDLNRHIRTCNFALSHLRIDKGLCIRMFNAD